MAQTVWRLLAQLVFGIDTASAILICAALGIGFRIEPDISHAVMFLAIAGFANYLPDLDLIPFLAFGKKFGWDNHWVVGHHPPLVIPGAALAAYAIATSAGSPDAVFIATLVATCVTAHFIHDSEAPYGLPWASPFYTKKHVVFSSDGAYLADRVIFTTHEIAFKAMQGDGLASKLGAYAEPVTASQMYYWGLAVIAFILWVS